MEGLEQLMALARSRDPADRARLLDALVTLCQQFDDAGQTLPPVIRQMLEALFLSVVADAEHDLRMRLSGQLADAAWAPKALIDVLAVDDIDIAGPIIAASPLLLDHDLVEILLKATLEHQMAVARRPSLGGPVVEAILDQADPAVMTALAANDTAQIDADAMQRLVAAAREVAALRSPLARHPRLTGAVAEHLYAWVGQSLRTALVSRFRIDGEALDEALARATRQARENQMRWTPFGGLATRSASESERALIAKLHAAGQLRPGYLMRSLREGRLNMFVEALAALGGFSADHIRRAVDSDRPELLALALVAVGVDRGVFPTILGLVRQINNNYPGGGEEGLRRAAGAFGPFNGAAAGSAFKQAVMAAG